MAVPVRQLLSQTSYDTDGVTTVWNFSFANGYLDRDYVKVQLVDKVTRVRTAVPITDANFLGEFQLSLTPAFPIGSELTIYRDSPKEAPLVDFADTASLTEASLDANARQAVHIAAESSDNLAVAIDSVSEISAQVEAAEAFADAAEASAISAAASAATATNQASLATSNGAAQVTLATGFANDAAASAVAADASADAAAASAASIAGGPVASVAGLTGIVSAASLSTALAPTMPGRFLRTTVFTASGTFTPLADTKKLHVIGQGSGGAGGGCQNIGAGQVSCGAGGGSGAYGEAIITSGITPTVAVTIGAAGVGAANATGNPGAISSFGAYLTLGGGGGGAIGLVSTVSAAQGGTAGAAGGTHLLFGSSGQFGESAISSFAQGYASTGRGGDSAFGSGGPGLVTGGPAAAGSGGAGRGVGGGGAGGIASGSQAAGGNGSTGVIIVHEYS